MKEGNDVIINNKLNEPYFEALSFFTKDDIITDNYKNNYKQLNFSQKTLKEFIEYFKKNIDEDNEEKEKFLNHPNKIFCFFLDQLHKLFKINKEEIDRKIDAPEQDPKIALNLFENFTKNDISYISENYFGKKLIIKTCKTCYTTYYLYKYIKVIPLDIKENKIETNLERCLNNIERKVEDSYFCQMCSNHQKFNISIKIYEKPKILIIIITNYNKKKLKIPLYIYNNCYKLIAAEVKYSKNDCNSSIINFFFCKKPGKYQFLFKDIDGKKNLINENGELKGVPYVLFYKRVKEENKKNYEYDFNSETNINENNNNMQVDIKNNINNINNMNSDEELINKAKGQNNDMSYSNDYNNIPNSVKTERITLYFRLTNNNKELYFDTDDTKPFTIIVQELKEKYQYLEYSISQNNLIYKDKIIDLKKTPKQLGMENESRILIQTDF